MRRWGASRLPRASSAARSIGPLSSGSRAGSTYFQPVPLLKTTGTPAPAPLIKGQPLSLEYKTDFVTFTQREQPTVSVQNSPLVFAGYGVVAPEYGWNDYAGPDVEGQPVVVLVNDPGNAGQDSTLLKGRAMTYCGRWICQYEETARHWFGHCGYHVPPCQQLTVRFTKPL
jgi:hypothetical protein